MLTAAAALLAILTALHLATCIAVALRLRAASAPVSVAERPAITLLRPVCGIENFIEETLRTSFHLDYPDYEIIFCAPSSDDPVNPLVRRLIEEHTGSEARLLIGDDRIGPNPKLNNLAKGWRAARHDFILMADSNIMLAPDYIDRLLARWHPDMGLVSAPAIGDAPDGFSGEIECAFLNTHQARWLYAAEMLGQGYAQGKTMLMRRSDLDRAGGYGTLASEIAEDAAARKAMLRLGKDVRLAFLNVSHPVGRRSFREVWGRQVRWARLRRSAFAAHYSSEILTGILPPLILLGILAAGPLRPAWIVPFIGLWYGAEAVLAAAARWRLSWSSPVAWLLRDLLLPIVWIAGWTRGSYVWRGNTVDVSTRRLTARENAGETRGR